MIVVLKDYSKRNINLLLENITTKITAFSFFFPLSKNWQTTKNTSENWKQKEFRVSVFRLIVESSQVNGKQ